jgi:hypothetical protein
MTTYIDSDTVPIGEFLSNASALRVPMFQRNYAWTDEEVKQLWLDITEAMDNDETEYFLGPMVLKDSSNHGEIIDGQQRVATVYVILSVIRRILRANGDNDRADWFNNEYFGKRDIMTLELQPKFQMNEINDPFFQKYIVADSDENGIRAATKGLLKKDTNYLLLQAIITIWDLLRERQKNFSGQEFDLQSLLSIERYLQQHVYVLILTVTDEADAYVIFETLNDRGRGLTTMDLLKNHVFDKASGQLDIVKAQWTVIRENLADIDPSERFLYHYWSSLHGRTSKSQLFRLMRKGVTNPRTAVAFARDLSKASKLYAAFSTAGHSYWDDYDQKTRDNLETLNLLDAQQALPILLAAAEKFTEVEFSKLTDYLVVMAVRYNLIGEERTGVLANYYVEIPKKIRSGELTKSAKIAREIKLIYPSDDNFKLAFSTKVLRDTRKARYLLMEIEKYSAGGARQIVDDPKKVNLEHILPRNPSQDWAETVESIGSDFVQEYISRLGNLALVSATPNKGLGSKSFSKKKELLYSKEKDIKYTALIANYSSWMKEDIENRQQTLAAQAVKVWRIDFI